MRRRILITGCSSGIGLHCAWGMRNRGWEVLTTARRDADIAHLRAAGFACWHLELADSDSVRALVADVREYCGGSVPDVLFANAAYGQPGAVEDLSRQALREQFEVNLFGTHELICSLLPQMRERNSGRLVVNSSMLGLVSFALRGAYNSSKFALEGLVDTLRVELVQTDIHVSLIEPGPVASRFRANAAAAFEHHIDADSGPHRQAYAAARRRFAATEGRDMFTLEPQAVLRALVHAAEHCRPRRRYPVTVPAHFFALARRILPAAALDWLVLRIARAEGGQGSD